MVARVVRREDVRAKTLDAWDHLNHVAGNETTRYGFHYCLEYTEKSFSDARRSRVTLTVRLGLIRNHVVDVFVDFIHHLKHQDHHEVSDRRAREQVSFVVANLDIKIVEIIFGENIPHGNLRVIGKVREPGNNVIDELKHVGPVRHHRGIIHGPATIVSLPSAWEAMYIPLWFSWVPA